MVEKSELLEMRSMLEQAERVAADMHQMLQKPIVFSHIFVTDEGSSLEMTLGEYHKLIQAVTEASLAASTISRKWQTLAEYLVIISGRLLDEYKELMISEHGAEDAAEL